jgi:hypothetical protein
VAEERVLVTGSDGCRLIELEIPRDAHLVGRHSQTEKAPGVLFGLHAKAPYVGKGEAEKGAENPVARERAVRDPSVYHNGERAPPAEISKEIGPEVRLHEEEEPGTHRLYHPSHYPPEIQGKVKHRAADAGQSFAGDLVPGFSRGRENELIGRIFLPKKGNQGENRHHLSHGEGVYPDYPIASGPLWKLQVQAQSGTEVPPILAGKEATKAEVTGDPRKSGKPRGVVEPVHGNLSRGRTLKNSPPAQARDREWPQPAARAASPSNWANWSS